MICVGERSAGHRPRFVPAESVFVHEQAHQLRNANRGVRIIELHGPFFMEVGGSAADQRLDVQHILSRMESGSISPICLKSLQCSIAMVTPAARIAGIFVAVDRFGAKIL